MILEITIAILLGILAGTFTGLIPGIHINLVSLLILSSSPFLLLYTTPIILAIFIVSMAITHTLFNAIPAIYLGAPESGDNALSVLPGHRMLLQGKAYEALALTIIGSILALIIGITLAPLILKILPKIYTNIQDYIGHILLIASLFLILRDNKKFWALIIFLLAGTFGLTVLNLNMKNPLFPLLSSLFGIAGILISLKDKVNIPEQQITIPKIFTKETFKALTSSTIVGTFTTMMPGLGPAQAAILGSQLTKLKDSGFLILVGALDTLGMVMSFIAIFSIEKARNGAVIIISRLLTTITLENLILFLGIALISGLISTYLCLKVAKTASTYITKINYEKLSIAIIILIIGMTLWLSSWIGLLILLIGSFMGMLPPLLGIGRNHLMGCLMLPVILFFLL
tara:strand:- start:2251 stop:3447 length:1197 start_codon:yes stop_codon:yes gene_type:complete